jgi:alpha-D-ribose 1-methylphosphonate 5-phosphate C-P lyase
VPMPEPPAWSSPANARRGDARLADYSALGLPPPDVIRREISHATGCGDGRGDIFSPSPIRWDVPKLNMADGLYLRGRARNASTPFTHTGVVPIDFEDYPYVASFRTNTRMALKPCYERSVRRRRRFHLPDQALRLSPDWRTE